MLLAYELYLPLAVAGFGLSSGLPGLWPGGLVVFGVHLAWAVLLGIISLAILKFHPLTSFGYSLGAVVGLTTMILLVSLGNFKMPVWNSTSTALPLPSPATATVTGTLTVTSTVTPLPPTLTLTSPPLTATLTRTPTRTLVPSLTPTQTITPEPTPLWAIVKASTGAFVRAEPKSNSAVVAGVLDGSLVQVKPGVMLESNLVWVHIITSKGEEGWILQYLLVTATPAPGW